MAQFFLALFPAFLLDLLTFFSLTGLLGDKMEVSKSRELSNLTCFYLLEELVFFVLLETDSIMFKLLFIE